MVDRSTNIQVMLAAILYTIALSLAIVGTMQRDVVILVWALIATKPAGLLTTYIMVQSDRLNLEHLLDNLVARARARAEVTRIR